MATHYIGRTKDGWLRVQLTNARIVPVPFGLKIRPIETKAGREHFEILEGVYKGKQASVPKPRVGSYLTTDFEHGPAVTVAFDRKSQALYFAGRGPYNAFSGGGHLGYTPVAPGTYDLAIPSHPPSQTRDAYSKWTAYHKIWFRIGVDVNGSRFLHPGAISEGCVTVRQFVYDPAAGAPPPAGFFDLEAGAKNYPGLLGLPLPKQRASTVGWDEIVNLLILSRKGDQAVGQLAVT